MFEDALKHAVRSGYLEDFYKYRATIYYYTDMCSDPYIVYFFKSDTPRGVYEKLKSAISEISLSGADLTVCTRLVGESITFNNTFNRYFMEKSVLLNGSNIFK